jgi:hypothetical protein
MKRARIVLAVVLTLGVIGGAFAFKAKSAFTGVTYYFTTLKGQPGTNTFPSAITTPSGTGKTLYITRVFNSAANVTAPYLTSLASE